MNEISIVDVGTFTIAVVALGLSLYNVYKQHYVRGPEFNLTETRVDARGEEYANVTVLIQNIGDRMGYIRWENINLKVNDDIYRIRKMSKKKYDWLVQANTQTLKVFQFEASLGIDLTGGIFIAKGAYSSHKGKMIENIWETPLIGKLKPINEERRIIDE